MNSISLQKFKAFDNRCEIELDGKNALFFGENGSGKSSVYDVLKICFHRKKLFDSIIPNTVVLPADRMAAETDILNSYNNQKTPLTSFSIEIDGNPYTSVPTADYDVNIINTDDIRPRDIIEIDMLLQSAMVNIADAQQYVADNKDDLVELFNAILNSDFHEPNLELSLNQVDTHWRVALKDKNRMTVAVNNNLCGLFNEAKLRIINFLILTTAILNNDRKKTAKHHVLVLDDVVGSMDSANRTFLLKYIHEYLNDYQKLIFTHSPSFFNITNYSFSTAWREKDRWIGFCIVEKAQDAEVHTLNSKSTKVIKKQYIPGDEFNAGNQLRQRFEYLVQEFSKIVCVGGIAEVGTILNAINNNDEIYYKWDAANKRVLTIYDMIKEIAKDVYADTSGSALSVSLIQIFDDYKANSDIRKLRNSLSELMIFQKVSLNPLSHSTGYTPMTTSHEVKRSMALLLKIEEHMNKLVGRDIYSY